MTHIKIDHKTSLGTYDGRYIGKKPKMGDNFGYNGKMLAVVRANNGFLNAREDVPLCTVKIIEKWSEGRAAGCCEKSLQAHEFVQDANGVLYRVSHKRDFFANQYVIAKV